MSDTPIFFEFDLKRAAYLALDTLLELGYRTSFVEGAEKPTLHVHVDKQDVASALEIAAAHGGRLTERGEAPSEERAFAMAYDLDEGIRIPAHVVNEDFTDSYVHPEAPAAAAESDDRGGSLIDSGNAFGEGFDPSGDTYDGFSAGIRL
jgi:hypothetical protein